MVFMVMGAHLLFCGTCEYPMGWRWGEAVCLPSLLSIWLLWARYGGLDFLIIYVFFQNCAQNQRGTRHGMVAPCPHHLRVGESRHFRASSENAHDPVTSQAFPSFSEPALKQGTCMSIFFNPVTSVVASAGEPRCLSNASALFLSPGLSLW